MIITYGLGLLIWTLNLILDNKGGKWHMAFLYFSQLHLLIVPFVTISYDIIAVASYGTRLEALYSWTGAYSIKSTGLDLTATFTAATRTT